MGSSFSSELDFCYVVLQGSILGPLIFNIDICGLFFVDITSNIANYANDTIPHECDQHCDSPNSNFELTVDKIFSWFQHINLKANASFFYHLINTLRQTLIDLSLKYQK